MAAIADLLRNDLKDDEFAEGYAESFLDTYVATQIKVLREQREMTQEDLAEAIGTTQTVISRIESADYSSRSLTTLKRLARAFELRLRVSFESVGSLIDEVARFDGANLRRPRRREDPILHPELAPKEQAEVPASSTAKTVNFEHCAQTTPRGVVWVPVPVRMAKTEIVAAAPTAQNVLPFRGAPYGR